MASSDVTLADVFDKAAELVETRGLTKHSFIDTKSGRICAAHAINLAIANYINNFANYEYNFSDAIEYIYTKIDKIHFRYASIVQWNDAPSRRKGEVVTFFRYCAMKWREEQNA